MVISIVKSRAFSQFHRIFSRICFIGAFSLPPAIVSGEVIYVNGRDDPTCADGGDGTSWATAYCSLHLALADAVAGDEIWLAEGKYHLDEAPYVNTDPAVTFVVPDGVSLYGGFEGTETNRDQADPANHITTLDGSFYWTGPNTHHYHVLTCGDNVLLSGLTITDGKADRTDAPHNEAGAIRLTDPTNRITLDRVNITGNQARRGAVSVGGVWTVTNSRIASNKALVDGGVAIGGAWNVSHSTIEFNDAIGNGGVANTGTWTAEHTTFRYNEAGNGGVFFNVDWTVRDSEFSHNTALGANRLLDWPDNVFNLGGGGVSVGVSATDPTTGTAINTLFFRNLADSGGVAGNQFTQNAYPDAHVINAYNCLFLENVAFDGGVGYNGTWNIAQCVFFANTAKGAGPVAAGGNWMVRFSTFSSNYEEFNEQYRTAVNDAFGYSRWTILDCVFDDTGFVPTTNLTLTYPEFPSERAKLLLSADTHNAVINDLTTHFAALDGVPGTAVPDPYFPSGTSIDDFVIQDLADSPFKNVNDPDGPDNEWGTMDDGLRLRENTPGEDQTEQKHIPFIGDQPLVSDFSGLSRALADYSQWPIPEKTVDLGAYEGSTITLNISASQNQVMPDQPTTTPNGTISWVRYHLIDLSTTAPQQPYPFVFNRWKTVENQGAEFAYPNSTSTSLIATQSLHVIAEYVQDLGDNDKDGLSNYDEIVVHGSNSTLADTSGDGLRDNILVDAGLDPTLSYSALVAEARRGLIDLRAGASLITRDQDGKLILDLQLERSSDLNNWSADPQDKVSTEIIPATEKEFYRFAID
jgi:hypothetical protein